MSGAADDRIPLVDFPAHLATDRAALQRAFDAVLDSGWLVLGEQLSAFEREFGAYCGASHCIGVGTGLDAIALALRALEVGPGDEVIVCAHGYVATWLAVEQVGATIVAVDAEPQHGCMDLDQVAAAITPATRAVVPVHLYGHVERMRELRALADAHDLAIVDDAAQAHGAADESGARAGSFADATAFSFYPSKNLGALGDGGAVTTDRGEVADRVRVLRNYGSRRRYENEVVGTNSRLDELQAAFLRARLPHLDVDNTRRGEIAARYAAALGGSEARLCQPRTGTTSAWHIAAIWLARRNELQAHLAANGIDTLIHYPVPPHLSGAFEARGLGPFPVAERIARETLSLPIGPHMPDVHIERITEALRRFLA